MPINRQFAAEAARGAVAIVLGSLVVVVGLSQFFGPLPAWRSSVRGAGFVVFLSVVVKTRRYRQRQGT